jgi:hypothetical protein
VSIQAIDLHTWQVIWVTQAQSIWDTLWRKDCLVILGRETIWES